MKRKPSLRFELLYDLSLLTFCAVILGCGLFVLLLRYDLPAQLSETVQSYLRGTHIAFEQYRAQNAGGTLERDFELFKLSQAEEGLSVDRSLSVIEMSTSEEIGFHIQEKRVFGVFPKVESYDYRVAVDDGGVRTYRYSADLLHQVISNNKSIVLLISVLITAVLVFVGYHLLFRRNIFFPIRDLNSTASAFLNENWDARVNVKRRDELGEIGEALNEMARKIQDREKKLVLSIESLKSANEELELRKNEQLQIEKLASVGRLAAGVAHEVGNPLGAISGYIDILRRAIQSHPEANPEDVELCDRIETETNRISKIIRALLQQARPPQDRIRPVALLPIIERSVDLAQLPADFDVEYEFENPEAEALAEKDQLIQVCLNLLINAKHAIRSKQEQSVAAEKGRIVLKCARRRLPQYNQKEMREDALLDTSVVRALKPQTYWMLSVVDNGTGISKEDQKKLFEPFFTTKETGKGTGLGLYVAKSIIESFRGTIAVQSSPGYGTSFSIFLPASAS